MKLEVKMYHIFIIWMIILHSILCILPVFREILILISLVYDFWDQQRECGIFGRDI